MKLLERLTWFSLVLSIGLLGAGYSFAGYGKINFGLPLFLFFWWVSKYNRFLWILNFQLVLFTFLVAIGTFIEVPSAWLLSGYLASIAAWDLGRVARRISIIEQDSEIGNFVYRHLVRLGWFLILSGLLSTAALLIRVQLGLSLTLFLGVLIALGLNLVLKFAKRLAG